VIGTNSNPKRYEKRMSERIKKHVDKRRKRLLSKQKRNGVLKEKRQSESPSELLWALLAYLCQRLRPLGESGMLLCLCMDISGRHEEHYRGIYGTAFDT
jgi:hypothetical protein